MRGEAGQHTPAARAAFYFSAHEDDWQLFMNPSAFRDVLEAAARCVFVHVTAGDAGLGLGKGGRKHPYYLARENGAEMAIRFMADVEDRPPLEPEVAAVSLAGHAVRRIGYRNAVAYFLRLPDGNASGDGYAETGWQSLRRLAGGEIDTLTAIDGSAHYRGWADLTATVRALIVREGAGAAVELHIPELDTATNPNDHSDHQHTAKAVRDAAKDIPARWMHHLGYACSRLAENLGGEDRDMKAAVYAVTMAGVLALDHPASWRHYDQLFVGRDYARVEGRAPA
jgi:hypothetical protein